tara:strand:- start:11803 stop:12588 length:786 start_codon:yes stop_codon:yes gene_type:complete
MSLAGNLKTVLGLVIVVVVIYLVYGYLSAKDYHLSKLEAATKPIVIEGSKLPTNKGAANYAYSIWFYVNDWGVDLSKTKPLLIRGGAGISNPSITLAPYENNINVSITTYPTSGSTPPAPQTGSAAVPTTSTAADVPVGGANGTPHECTIRNFPLQKWVNLIVSLNGRTLDLYIDGKLVRTCVLPGVAKVDATSNINITPAGGFDGWTSNLQYFAYPLNPQEAYNIYKDGPGSGGIFGFFEKYKLKVSYLVDNKEKGSISI